MSPFFNSTEVPMPTPVTIDPEQLQQLIAALNEIVAKLTQLIAAIEAQ